MVVKSLTVFAVRYSKLLFWNIFEQDAWYL